MTYPPAAEEIRLLARRHPQVPRRQIERLVQAANALRQDESLRIDLSMRATEEVCTLLEHPNFADDDGDPLPDLLKTSFCARFPGRWDDPTTAAGLAWHAVVRALEL
jgi:nitric oxide reductase NorQ protein